jgi:hypothetical protein
MEMEGRSILRSKERCVLLVCLANFPLVATRLLSPR